MSHDSSARNEPTATPDVSTTLAPQKHVSELVGVLGFSIENEDVFWGDKWPLLEQAVTHKSFRHENGQSQTQDNERLEFLGDAVLDLALSDLLMRKYDSANEGSLSKRRASLVNEESLATIALEIGMPNYLRLGRGERATGGLQKPRLLASALEATLGALFLTVGFEAARDCVERLFASSLSRIDGSLDFQTDYKTRLQELAQEQFKVTPTYAVIAEKGPDHDKEFAVEVRVGEREACQGTGRSKKAAEQDAAKQALEKLK